AAEMIFEAGALDLLSVVKVFGSDEADDSIEQKRIERARDTVGPGFHGLLIDAVVSFGGQRGALPRLEIHHVGADRAAFERERRAARFGKNAERDAEPRVRLLGSGYRLKDEIHRRALLDRADRRRHVSEAAALHRRSQAPADVVEDRDDADVI